jgi:hypothetical protein
MGFRKGRFGDFFGHHATAAECPPENLFERLRREFVFRQRSEDVHGRKKILSPGETPLPFLT